MRLRGEFREVECSALLDMVVRGWSRDIEQLYTAGPADRGGEASEGLDDLVLGGVPDDGQDLVGASRIGQLRLLLDGVRQRGVRWRQGPGSCRLFCQRG